MSCTFFDCDPCAGGCQPLSTSGKAICAANCVTTGTQCTINSIITGGSFLAGTILNNKQQQQTNAVKAQTQIAQNQMTSITLIVLAIIAVIGFITFANMRRSG